MAFSPKKQALWFSKRPRESKCTPTLSPAFQDNQTPPKQSSTMLKIVVGQQAEIQPHFTQSEYYANFTRVTFS
jgi:hypothetical protein